MSKRRTNAEERLTDDRGRSPAFIFDLDGTLVDSVYQHVLAWREALEHARLELSVWRIHRRIGMSGGLFVNALSRETGRRITPQEAARLQRDHVTAFRRQSGKICPLPAPGFFWRTCRSCGCRGRLPRAAGSKRRNPR